MKNTDIFSKAWAAAREAAARFGGKASDYFYSGIDPTTGETVKGTLEEATEEYHKTKNAHEWLAYVMEWLGETIEAIRYIKSRYSAKHKGEIHGPVQDTLEEIYFEIQAADVNETDTMAARAQANRHAIERDFSPMEEYASEDYNASRQSYYERMALDLKGLIISGDGAAEIETGEVM